MKRIILLSVMGMVCMGAMGDYEFHIFTDTQGRTIQGEVLSYDVKKQTVLIKRDNGAQARVPLTLLCEEDQKYIKAWDLLKDFMNERRFKISAKRKKFENDADSSKDFNSRREVENMGYEVRLENGSDATFKKITIEYCIFYEQEVARGGNQCLQGVYCGKFNVDKMPPKSKEDVITKTVKIYKDELNADWHYGSGADNVQRGRVHGVWMRASMTLPSGEKVVREYSLPDSLPNSRQWTTKSVNVGMN